VNVVVVADTHLPRGGRRLAEECVRLLGEADLVLHSGDFTAASVFEELGRIAPVVAVHGNMDEPELRERLPERRVVEVGAARIGMVHDPGPALGRHARLMEAFPRCHAVVYGHTHMPEVTVHGGVVVLNPGSPTERRRAATRSLATLRVRGTSVVPELVPLGP
jgi:putative phosphoesterase